MLVITVIPLKSTSPTKQFKERIKAVKDLRGTISIERDYIVSVANIKGDN